ncbi:ABC transporter permease [Paludibacterium paludis]|nr:ABC transporter permease subunit [Paludibacterium paludis]
MALLLDPSTQWRLGWSAAQALATCLVVLLLGVPLSWFVARHAFAGRSLLLRLMMLPFVMPTLVAGVGILTLFGSGGILGCELDESAWLLLYGNVFYNLPLVLRAGVEGFSRVPDSHVSAARVLGAGRVSVFFRIEWPQACPWFLSALCMVFLYCFSGFGIALLLGGYRYATVEVEIYRMVAYELNLGDAAVLAAVSMGFAAVVALLHGMLERRLARPLAGHALALRPVTGWQAITLAVCCLSLLMVFLFAPLAAIVWRAAASGAWHIWLEEETRVALLNTLRFTALTLIGVTTIGLCHAFASRHPVMRAMAWLPVVVSPVCVAFGLLVVYPGWSASLALLLSGYVLLAYPFVARSVANSLDSLPDSWLAASRTLGRGTFSTLWFVVLPLVAPALRRGLAFAAATAVGEFAVTLFLSRPEWMTLTTLIYQRLGRAGQSNIDAASCLSGGLLIFALLAFVLIEWPDHRKENRA